MSIWENVDIPSFPRLNKNKQVNILIIGGGLSGIHACYVLKEEKNICLVEANTLGCGVTKNSTGKLSFLQDSTLGFLIQKKKWKDAKLYLKSQLEGIKQFQNIIQKEKIHCDLEKVSSYLVTNQEKYISLLEEIELFLKEEGIDVKNRIPEKYLDFIYGIQVENTFVFHPLKYLKGIVEKINTKEIYEHTRIISILKRNDKYECLTNQGFTILAKKVIVACHYPFFLFPYFLPLKSSIEKSYILTKKVSENLKYSYITIENPSMSSRFYQDEKEIYQLFLGSSHSTSIFQNDEQNFKNVKDQNNISEKKIINSWSNVDIKTFDHLPFIGEIKKNIYLITGFETWGLIQSLVSTNLIKEWIRGKNSELAYLFSPKRSFWKRLIVSPYYLLLNGYSFMKSKFYLKKWYPHSLMFYYKKGKLLANYCDEFGVNHVVHPICPHMKCNLIFNEKEKTWDCPCHSSQFDLDGNILKGPSKKSIAYPKK